MLTFLGYAGVIAVLLIATHIRAQVSLQSVKDRASALHEGEDGRDDESRRPAALQRES